MKRLMLTGASGFLGWNVCAVGSKQWDITGIVNKHDIAIPDVELLKVDLTDDKQLSKAFASIRPDAVIHLAANSDPNYCQQHPEETHIINVDVTAHIASLCAKAIIPFVFTSTDLVFDGIKGNYTETYPLQPVNTYGRQKIAAEKAVLDTYPDATICRMPLMFGYGGPAAKSFIQPFLQKMRAGEPLQLFHDEYRSVVGGRSAATGLLLAADKLKGVYHLGGRERLSRYEFGLMIKEAFNLPNAIITSSSQKDVQMPAPRPADVSMDSSKAYAQGYTPMGVIGELEGLVGTV